MKTLILLPFLAIFGCDLITEEVQVEKIVEKIVKGDSIPYPVYITVTDSFPYPVYITDSAALAKCDPAKLDTVYLPGEPYPVYVYDSVHVVQHHYSMTMYIPLGWSTTDIREYEGSVSAFYTLAYQYGWDFYGGDILIEYWTFDEAPPASRSSYSTIYFDQFILKIKDTLTPDEAFTPIFRELARWQLGKKYTNEPDDIMNPEFSPQRLKLSSSDAEKKPYLDRLFAKEPI